MSCSHFYIALWVAQFHNYFYPPSVCLGDFCISWFEPKEFLNLIFLNLWYWYWFCYTNIYKKKSLFFYAKCVVTKYTRVRCHRVTAPFIFNKTVWKIYYYYYSKPSYFYLRMEFDFSKHHQTCDCGQTLRYLQIIGWIKYLLQSPQNIKYFCNRKLFPRSHINIFDTAEVVQLILYIRGSLIMLVDVLKIVNIPAKRVKTSWVQFSLLSYFYEWAVDSNQNTGLSFLQYASKHL